MIPDACKLCSNQSYLALMHLVLFFLHLLSKQQIVIPLSSCAGLQDSSSAEIHHEECSGSLIFRVFPPLFFLQNEPPLSSVLTFLSLFPQNGK
ncbi:hypothetical protein KP509_30G060700 [Ceratopteris richardii]|uniref:Uncharacterized protein n=1 Tax=Ceratopteris richardii TaxID=49495 RepID=A0A8T2R405_CERRI|nr:hypothetical protein KP509_30G060700 [Ceratopteris richardii]